LGELFILSLCWILALRACHFKPSANIPTASGMGLVQSLLMQAKKRLSKATSEVADK
jgi:hypothetical protein